MLVEISRIRIDSKADISRSASLGELDSKPTVEKLRMRVEKRSHTKAACTWLGERHAVDRC